MNVGDFDHIVFQNYSHLPFLEWMQKRKRKLEGFLVLT